MSVLAEYLNVYNAIKSENMHIGFPQILWSIVTRELEHYALNANATLRYTPVYMKYSSRIRGQVFFFLLCRLLIRNIVM